MAKHTKQLRKLFKHTLRENMKHLYVMPTGDPNKDFDGFHTIIEKDIAENENLYPTSGPEV